MSEKQYELIIFDWDGTLSDSVSLIAECMQSTAVEHNLAVPSHQQASDIIGLGLGQAIKTLFPPADQQLIDRLSQTYSKHYRQRSQGPSHFFPDVLEVLQALKDKGYLLAVATGKSHAGLNRELLASGLEGFFDATRCADQTASKPDPLMLQQLLDQFNVSADQSIMVGDTEYDMEMAMRKRMPRLAVSYGAHESERLLKYQPVACIDHFSEIINYL
jgi:phosphoglycolate phosphatase